MQNGHPVTGNLGRNEEANNAIHTYGEPAAGSQIMMADVGPLTACVFQGYHTYLRSEPGAAEAMVRIAPRIPRHIVQRGDRRHGSGNECGVPGIPGGEDGKKRKKLRSLIRSPPLSPNVKLPSMQLHPTRIPI